MDSIDKRTSGKASARCRSCGNMVPFGVKPKVGAFLVCPSCGLDLVITSISPESLDWAFEEDKQLYKNFEYRSSQTGENA